MDKFPRDKQNQLLMFLYEKAPDDLTIDEYKSLIKLFGNKINLYLNLWYLFKHGLIKDFYNKNLPLDKYKPADRIDSDEIHITEKGVDFIRDDGGLSAILNVMTIKIHDDTIEKLKEIIQASHLPVNQKKAYLRKLQELPADATKHLVLQLLDLGLSRVPDVLQLITSLFQ